MKPTAYGQFSKDGHEFILRRPLLDRPWMNVLSNGAWCDVMSHLGGGYSFLGNPTVARLTRWHVDGVPRDTTGKFLFIRDEQSGKWWNANGYPPTRALDAWQCRVGLGYNRIVARQDGIEADQVFFAPMPDAGTSKGDDVGDPCLLWKVRLTNKSKRRRVVSATSYVEIALGNWYEDTSWREFYILFNRQEMKDGVLFTRMTQWVKYIGGWQAGDSESNNIPFDKAVFLASSAPVTGYEGDRYAFIGSYRDLSNPRAMDTGKPCNSKADGRDACASLQHRFKLKPGESVEFVLLFGAVPREAPDASGLTAKYLTVEKADAAFANNQTYWSNVVATPRIQTPDPDLDTMVNCWFKYQGANLSWWNRNTGYCYFGIYNYGVRDACQDAVSRLPQDPAWVRDIILKRIFIWQFLGGDWAHGGNFVNHTGTRTFHSDDPLNPCFIIARYIRETGDFSILEERTPFLKPEGGFTAETATVYEHCVRSLDFFWTQFSERGLPLILKADWNDALNQMGNRRKGESVMNAGWAIICIEDFYAAMERMGDTAKLADYKARIARLKHTVNDLCWDGEWYWRATHDSGWVTGSRKNTDAGMIYANPNSFAVIAGIADKAKSDRIFAAFEKYLDTPWGSYCFFPPFPEPDRRTGTISIFYPGTKENGSLQGHNSRWRIWAECVAGRGDKAYEILKKMLPCTRHEADPDLYRIEPYVACQFIYAPESGRPGEGSHSWATGTACWTLLNVWEHLLGIQPELGGLRIDPCLPKAWTKAKMIRAFRGDTYAIEIRKPKGIGKGHVSLEMDGKPLAGNLVPPVGDGRSHTVIARIE
jgi:cellobiose phosphorylase